MGQDVYLYKFRTDSLCMDIDSTVTDAGPSDGIPKGVVHFKQRNEGVVAMRASIKNSRKLQRFLTCGELRSVRRTLQSLHHDL